MFGLLEGFMADLQLRFIMMDRTKVCEMLVAAGVGKQLICRLF